MAATDFTFAGALTGKNPNVTSFTVLAQNGVRPNYSHDGTEIVYDYYDVRGYNKLGVLNTSGAFLRTLTDAAVTPALGALGFGQRSTGNAQFSPDDAWIVYIAEAEKHYQDNVPGNPGTGIYMNLWACNRAGTVHYKLTNLPILVSTTGGAMGSFGAVNPHFSEDGAELIWTKHYGDDSRTLGWGLWQIMYAQWDTTLGYPRLLNPRPLYTPTVVGVTDPYSGLATLQNNYVTAMAKYGSPSNKLLLAQNALMVNAYGMDQCTYDVTTTAFANLTNDAVHWMEDACLSPYPSIATAARNFVYMSNEIMPANGAFGGSALDGTQADWPHQPRQREWFYRKVNDGSGKTQLTSFNDATAPEYVGRRVIVASCSIAPDGLSLVGTFGIDWNAGAAYVAGVASNVFPNTAISLKVIRLTFAAAI